MRASCYSKSLEMAVRRVGGRCEMASSLGVKSVGVKSEL
jgi:hypothetical protein